ncbi:hypothetical protein MNBD_BACTEROID03-2534 [hydrothermal vent metagenome]|uniref:Uncharacterized protein n=1 Tax=hydrothermal vent metagenome TaxID=652676 RepID=A0A3B0TAT2_9ZZZZ
MLKKGEDHNMSIPLHNTIIDFHNKIAPLLLIKGVFHRFTYTFNI